MSEDLPKSYFLLRLSFALCHIELVPGATGWASLYKGYGSIILFLGQLAVRLQMRALIPLKYPVWCGAFLIAALYLEHDSFPISLILLQLLPDLFCHFCVRAS
jgi:hypothetical protein